jgi:mannose/fructose-specific phosphotransferase system component IIA
LLGRQYIVGKEIVVRTMAGGGAAAADSHNHTYGERERVRDVVALNTDMEFKIKRDMKKHIANNKNEIIFLRALFTLAVWW